MYIYILYKYKEIDLVERVFFKSRFPSMPIQGVCKMSRYLTD